MASTEERLQILRMIEKGSITAKEGQKLLDALGARQSGSGDPSGSQARWIRIRVSNGITGKSRINVNLPIQLVDMGLKVAARFAPEMEDLDIEGLRQTIRSGIRGKLLEVDDEDENEHVEIFVE